MMTTITLTITFRFLCVVKIDMHPLVSSLNLSFNSLRACSHFLPSSVIGIVYILLLARCAPV